MITFTIAFITAIICVVVIYRLWKVHSLSFAEILMLIVGFITVSVVSFLGAIMFVAERLGG